MYRVWQIMEMEDLPGLNDQFRQKVLEKIIRPYYFLLEKGYLQNIVFPRELFELDFKASYTTNDFKLPEAKNILEHEAKGDDKKKAEKAEKKLQDFQIANRVMQTVPTLSKITIVVGDEFEDYKRFPVYKLNNQLIDTWLYAERLSEYPSDIIILDIKMNEYSEIVKEDNAEIEEKTILLEFVNALNIFSKAFLPSKNLEIDQIDTSKLNDFRECGGLVIYGKIQRVLRENFKSKRYDDPPPMVCIQTASTTINGFSTFEFAFPHLLSVVDKGSINKNDYDIFFINRIKQLINSGNIDYDLILYCKEEFEKIFSTNDIGTDEYKDACGKLFLTALSDNPNGWIFATLFPWICKDIYESTNKNNADEIVTELDEYIEGVNYSDHLFEFLEPQSNKHKTNPEKTNPIRYYSHGTDDINVPEWGTNIKTIAEKGLTSKSIKAILNSRPSFLTKFDNDEYIPEDNINCLKDLNSCLIRLPQEDGDLLDIIEAYEYCEKHTINGYDKLDEKCSKCPADPICMLENFKYEMRGHSSDGPISPVLKIFKDLFNNPLFKITPIEILPANNDESENLISLTSIPNINGIRKTYFPFEDLKNFISAIFKHFSKKEATVSVQIGVFYDQHSETINIYLFFPGHDTPNLDKVSYESSGGTFTPAVKKLKFWCKILISSLEWERNVYMQPLDGRKKIDPINGTLYQIFIPARKDIKFMKSI